MNGKWLLRAPGSSAIVPDNQLDNFGRGDCVVCTLEDLREAIPFIELDEDCLSPTRAKRPQEQQGDKCRGFCGDQVFEFECIAMPSLRGMRGVWMQRQGSGLMALASAKNGDPNRLAGGQTCKVQCRGSGDRFEFVCDSSQQRLVVIDPSDPSEPLSCGQQCTVDQLRSLNPDGALSCRRGLIGPRLRFDVVFREGDRCSVSCLYERRSVTYTCESGRWNPRFTIAFPLLRRSFGSTICQSVAAACDSMALQTSLPIGTVEFSEQCLFLTRSGDVCPFRCHANGQLVAFACLFGRWVDPLTGGAPSLASCADRSIGELNVETCSGTDLFNKFGESPDCSGRPIQNSDPNASNGAYLVTCDPESLDWDIQGDTTRICGGVPSGCSRDDLVSDAINSAQADGVGENDLVLDRQCPEFTAVGGTCRTECVRESAKKWQFRCGATEQWELATDNSNATFDCRQVEIWRRPWFFPVTIVATVLVLVVLWKLLTRPPPTSASPQDLDELEATVRLLKANGKEVPESMLNVLEQAQR
ncbi:MAG: hypothetical protein MHM6MM_004574 [Cercozoa sp. M6MM]